MIDRKITDFQEYIIIKANRFVYKDTGPYSGSEGVRALGRLQNRIVMTLAVGVTSALDYFKLPLATIEELAKGILLTPTIPFSRHLRDRCFTHYGHGLQYVVLIPSKLILGTIHDLYTLYIALRGPHLIPTFIPPSYYGAQRLYQRPTEAEQDYPSIYQN